MDKGGHYDLEMKGWMQNLALRCANQKGGWIRMGIMMCKSMGGWKRWHYDVEIKWADG